MNARISICVLPLVIASAAVSAAAPASLDAGQRPIGPFFAMDTVANRGAEPIGQKLDDLKALGYAGLCWTGTDIPQIQSVIRECERRNLKMYALYVGFPLTRDGITVPSNIDRVFQAVANHGTVVWVYIQSNDFKPSDGAGDTVAVPDLQKLADRAAKSGVKLALYPHAGFWAQSFPDCLRLAKKVDRPNFGVSFNLCHVLKTGDEKNVIALLKESQGCLFMVSVNGADAGAGPAAGWDRLIQPIGRGTYDLAPLLKQLRAQGYTGPIGFQGYGIKGERLDIMKQTMEGWKKIVGGQ